MFIEFMALLFGGTFLAGKAIKEIARSGTTDNWYESQGFNKERQWEVERMLYSTDPYAKEEIKKILKRTVNLNDDFDCKLAVRQISIHEGWKYYDINEIETDPDALKAMGRKLPEYEKPYQYYGKAYTGEEMAAKVIAETNRRNTWILRCPHGPEMKLFPMDYIDERKYQRAVAYEFSKSSAVKSKIEQYNRLRDTTIEEMDKFLDRIYLFDKKLKDYFDSLRDDYWIAEKNVKYGHKIASVYDYQLYLLEVFHSDGVKTGKEVCGIDYGWWRKMAK